MQFKQQGNENNSIVSMLDGSEKEREEKKAKTPLEQKQKCFVSFCLR